MSKDGVSEQSNPQNILNKVSDDSTQKINPAFLSEEYLFFACSLLGAIITILLFIALKILGKAAWSLIGSLPLAESASVIATVAASITVLFLLIRFIRFGKRLFRAFWDSLGVD